MCAFSFSFCYIGIFGGTKVGGGGETSVRVFQLK